MIYKSYQIETNLDNLKNKVVLFYGENLGLIDEFKHQFKLKYKKAFIKVFHQDEIIKDQSALLNEISNISMFEEMKVLFIENANDKILEIVKDVLPDVSNKNLIVIFANVLEKKSKLRNFFEKNERVDIVPCYQDNEQTIKKLIFNELKDFSGLSHKVVNLIVNACGTNRSKLKNEISKIKHYFSNKKIDEENLKNLLNLKEVDDFNLIRDAALEGQKENINKLLSTLVLDVDKISFYISLINQRIIRLNEVLDKNDIEEGINQLRPPLFWKDKSNFIIQSKIWNSLKIRKAIEKIHDLDLMIKSNSTFDKKILLKKLIIDICGLANAA